MGNLRNRNRTHGFTLLELLVVIAIIGVLSTIVLAALNDSRNKAAASGMAQQLQQISTGLRVYLLSEGVDQWFDSSFNNRTINQIRNDPSTNVEDYLPELPLAPNGEPYIYRINGTYSCGVAHSGISIRVSDLHLDNPDIYDALERAIDNNDGSDCGRVRHRGTSESLYFLIARDIDDI